MDRLRVRSLYHRQHIKHLRRLHRSGGAFVSRWATILLLSHQGRSVQEIAVGLGLPVQTVRERIRVFNHAERHIRWQLLRPPRRPGRTPTYAPDVRQGLVDRLKQSPETFGVDRGVWRLQDVVTMAVKTGLVRGASAKTFNVETVRRLLRPAGYAAQSRVYLSAKRWISRDDPHYAHKKARRDKLLAWARSDPSVVVVFQDESWFSGNPKPVGPYGRPDQPHDAAVEKPAHQLKGAWVL